MPQSVRIEELARITLPQSLTMAHQMIVGREQRIVEQNRAAVKLQADKRVAIEALDKVIALAFEDAVNGHLLDQQVITREQIGELYEVARKARALLGER